VKLAVDVYESELLGKLDDIGWAMAKCDGKGKGIDAILRFGAVRKCSREADRVNLSGKGRVFRSTSMLAFP
jgi:hypothetical protein